MSYINRTLDWLTDWLLDWLSAKCPVCYVATPRLVSPVGSSVIRVTDLWRNRWIYLDTILRGWSVPRSNKNNGISYHNLNSAWTAVVELLGIKYVIFKWLQNKHLTLNCREILYIWRKLTAIIICQSYEVSMHPLFIGHGRLYLPKIK